MASVRHREGVLSLSATVIKTCSSDDPSPQPCGIWGAGLLPSSNPAGFDSAFSPSRNYLFVAANSSPASTTPFRKLSISFQDEKCPMHRASGLSQPVV